MSKSSRSNSSNLHVTKFKSKKRVDSVKLLNTPIPDEEIVDQLFERLLSIRVFPEEAIYSLKMQPKERKWELLLREHNTNNSFDLDKLSKQETDRFFANRDKFKEREFLMMNRSDSSESKPKLKSLRIVSNTDSLIDSELLIPPKDASRTITVTKIFPEEPTTRKLSLDSGGSGGTASENDSLLGMVNKKLKLKDGSPEWFVSRIMANKLSVKDCKKLEKKLVENTILKHGGISWIQGFTNAQGETALSVVLSKINKKSIKSNDEFDKEYLIVKCLKHINAERSDQPDQLKEKIHVVKALVFLLVSPRLTTRILVTEVLVMLMLHRSKTLWKSALESLSNLQDRTGDYSIFQPWLNAFEETIIKYSWSQNKAGELSNLKNYAAITLILINSMVDICDSLKRRISVRRDFSNARILNIFEKLKKIEDRRINNEIERYEASAEEDYVEFVEIKKKRNSKQLPNIPFTPKRLKITDFIDQSASSLAGDSTSETVIVEEDEEMDKTQRVVYLPPEKQQEDVIKETIIEEHTSEDEDEDDDDDEVEVIDDPGDNFVSFISVGTDDEDEDEESDYVSEEKSFMTKLKEAEDIESDTAMKNVLNRLMRLKQSKRSSADVHKMLVLVDSMLHHVTDESRVIGTDSETVLNITIQKLMDRLTTDDTARRAIAESQSLARELEHLKEEKTMLEEEIGTDKLEAIHQLKSDNHVQEETIAKQQQEIAKLQAELKSAKEKFEEEAKRIPVIQEPIQVEEQSYVIPRQRISAQLEQVIGSPVAKKQILKRPSTPPDINSSSIRANQ
ncbi:BNR1 Formin BNR1 [Candida maltosa Xu316]